MINKDAHDSRDQTVFILGLIAVCLITIMILSFIPGVYAEQEDGSQIELNHNRGGERDDSHWDWSSDFHQSTSPTWTNSTIRQSQTQNSSLELERLQHQQFILEQQLNATQNSSTNVTPMSTIDNITRANEIDHINQELADVAAKEQELSKAIQNTTITNSTNLFGNNAIVTAPSIQQGDSFFHQLLRWIGLIH